MILFLGSGVSLASGLPSVQQLTDELIHGAPDDRITCLLKLLRDIDSEYLNNSAPFKLDGELRYSGQIFRESTTYEDLFYLARQIDLNGQGLRADATVGAFSSFLTTKAKHFLKGRTKVDREIELHRLASHCANYIEERVALKLKSESVLGLDLVLELATSENASDLKIVTLNHDTLVEQLLSSAGVEYDDGFGRPDGDVRWYEGEFGGRLVTLIKPHGSVNWWRQELGKVLQPAVVNAVASTWRDRTGDPVSGLSKRPHFLTGLNKIYSYNHGIFADAMFELLSLLKTERTIVMSGYGWGDLPINSQILNWFDRDEANRLILLHKEPENLRDGSMELRHVYAKYLESGKLVVLRKWMSETTLAELLPNLQVAKHA